MYNLKNFPISEKMILISSSIIFLIAQGKLKNFDNKNTA